MDIICQGCGEPWDLYYVMHEDRESFVLEMPDGEEEAFEGHLIIDVCPCCIPNGKGKVFLTGKDYPHLCNSCQLVINQITEMFNEGLMEDTDDQEAPCMYAYDHCLFCGGRECRKKTKVSGL